jgi:hypothetical protein
MIKSTQEQITNIIFEAIEYSFKVTVSFDTKFTIEESIAALREAIFVSPIAKVENTFVKLLEKLRERTYTGVIVSTHDSGLCKIKLDNNEFKSFYINNVRSITASGFTYYK